MYVHPRPARSRLRLRCARFSVAVSSSKEGRPNITRGSCTPASARGRGRVVVRGSWSTRYGCAPTHALVLRKLWYIGRTSTEAPWASRSVSGNAREREDSSSWKIHVVVVRLTDEMSAPLWSGVQSKRAPATERFSFIVSCVMAVGRKCNVESPSVSQR